MVKSADVTYVRFANLGKEPIRKADIASANVLRLEVEWLSDGRGKPLDIALAASTRDVIQLSVGPLQRAGTVASVDLSFDFLDYTDGGLLRVLSNGPPASVAMRGDIVGMPQGLHEWNAEQDQSTEIKGWGILGWALAELVAFAVLALLFRQATGAWDGVWMLLLPPVVFVVVLILCLVIAGGPSAYKRRRLRFPHALAIPRHFAFATLVGPDGEYMVRRMGGTARQSRAAGDSDGDGTPASK